MSNPLHFPIRNFGVPWGALLAFSLIGCSSPKPKPSVDVAPPALDDLVLESDWVGEADLNAIASPPSNGTLPIRVSHAIKDFENLDSIRIPWPFSSNLSNGSSPRDSGAYFLLLRKGPNGQFLKPVLGRTAFLIQDITTQGIIHDYVAFRFGGGFPEIDSHRSGMAVFGPDSGIERFSFTNYLTESLIYWILTKNDSLHYSYLREHSGFQSNNADIMLHYLAQTDHVEMLGYFVEQGNDIDFSDHNLFSPLWVCMSKRNLACMDTVKAYGANLNLVTPDDEERYKMTPLHAATRLEHPNLVRWLRKNGAGLYYRDQDGSMPLHKAACSDSGILKLLAYANDSLSARDAKGKTALDLAKDCARAKNVELLTKASQSALLHQPNSNLAPKHGLADPPHSGKKLFARPRVERLRIAGDAMVDLVRLGCGLQGLEFNLDAGAADTLCNLAMPAQHPNSRLGPALAATLEKSYSTGEVDTLLVRYTQVAQGNPFPIWISKKLQPGMRELFEMQSQFQEQILKRMIDIMGVEKNANPSGKKAAD